MRHCHAMWRSPRLIVIFAASPLVIRTLPLATTSRTASTRSIPDTSVEVLRMAKIASNGPAPSDLGQWPQLDSSPSNDVLGQPGAQRIQPGLRRRHGGRQICHAVSSHRAVFEGQVERLLSTEDVALTCDREQTRSTSSSSTLRSLLPKPTGRSTTRCLQSGSVSMSGCQTSVGPRIAPDRKLHCS